MYSSELYTHMHAVLYLLFVSSLLYVQLLTIHMHADAVLYLLFGSGPSLLFQAHILICCQLLRVLRRNVMDDMYDHDYNYEYIFYR